MIKIGHFRFEIPILTLIGPFWLRLVSKMTEFINDHLAIAVSKMTILSRIWLKIAVSGSILYQNNNLYDSLPFQT